MEKSNCVFYIRGKVINSRGRLTEVGCTSNNIIDLLLRVTGFRHADHNSSSLGMLIRAQNPALSRVQTYNSGDTEEERGSICRFTRG